MSTLESYNYKTITLNRDKQRCVDTICFNRPKRLNTMNVAMIDDLLYYFECITKDDLLSKYIPRVIVMKGKGKSFCAGLDLFGEPSSKSSSKPNWFKTQRRISTVIMRMRRCKPPIVSLLQGPVCGGGFALALASDIRLGIKDLKMNVAMAKIGLSGCDVGISYFLPRLIGGAAASELMLTGKWLKAERAYTLGLLASIHNTYKEMENALQELLNDMLNVSKMGLWMTKEGINCSYSAGSLEAQIALEDRNQVLCTQDDEFKEKIMTFISNQRKKKKSKL